MGVLDRIAEIRDDVDHYHGGGISGHRDRWYDHAKFLLEIVEKFYARETT